MPEIRIPELCKDASIRIWEIAEPLAFFMERTVLGTEEKETCWALMGKRQSEYVVQRFLVQDALQDTRVQYRKTLNGKPYLANRSEHISVSHTRQYLAASIAPEPHGLDLEMMDGRIVRLASKFCNNTEMKTPAFTDPVTWLTLVWSCKEALYKVDGLGNLEFRTQLAVHFTADSFKSGWGRGLIIRGKKQYFLRLYFYIMNDMVITLAYPA